MKRIVKYTDEEYDEKKFEYVVHTTELITQSHNQLFDVLRELLRSYKSELVSIERIK